MKDRTSSGMDALPIITFSQNFKVACDVCNIHEEATIQLFKYYLTKSVEKVIEIRVTLPTETAKLKEWCSISFSTIVINPLQQIATYDNITTVDTDIQNFKWDSSTALDHAQRLWTKTLWCSFIYNQKIFKSLFC